MTKTWQRPTAGLKKKLLCHVMVGTALALVVAWSVASPPGSTPDENYHIGNTWCAFGESTHCSILKDRSEGGYRWARIPFSVDLCFNRSPEVPASCIEKEHPDSQVVPIDNISSLYPPQFYVVGNILFRFFNNNGILAFRIFNGILFVALLIFALYLARPIVRNALLTSLFVFLVPQGIYLIASVNPSSWSFAGVITSWAFLETFFHRLQYEKRTEATVSLVLWILSIIISSARYDSLVFVVVLSIAVTCFHAGWLWKNSKTFLVSIGILFTATTALTQKFVTSIVNRTMDMVSDPAFYSFARYWLIHFLEIPLTSMGLNYGSYGPTGSLDVLTPPLVGHIQFGVLAAALLCSLRIRVQPQRIFLMLFLLVLFVLITQEVSRYHETGFYFVQGRYFLPFIAGAVGIVVARSHPKTSLFDTPALKMPLIGILSISHLLNLFSVIRRYSFGTTNDYKRFDFDVDKNFSLPDGWRYLSSFSPQFILIYGSVAFVLFAWTIITIFSGDNCSEDQQLVSSQIP